jgi:hypothetical protein
MSQKVLIMNTDVPSLRDEVWGWGSEDSSLFNPRKPIGFTLGYSIPSYKTVLEALADGWKLLGPPQLENIRPAYKEAEESWAWWLIKE